MPWLPLCAASVALSGPNWNCPTHLWAPKPPWGVVTGPIPRPQHLHHILVSQGSGGTWGLRELQRPQIGMIQVPDIAGMRGQMATVSAQPLCTNPPHLASPLQGQRLCPARLLVPARQSAVPGPALSPHQENGHAAGAPAGLAGTWGLLACKSGGDREGKVVPGQDQDGHSSPVVLDC